jgi:hypothetical protein
MAFDCIHNFLTKPPIFEDKDKTANDEEEKELEQLAKRFAKRARMQRLIEAHGNDEEFSQMRLIDEDESTRLELKMMKVRSCDALVFRFRPSLKVFLLAKNVRTLAEGHANRPSDQQGHRHLEGRTVKEAQRL